MSVTGQKTDCRRQGEMLGFEEMDDFVDESIAEATRSAHCGTLDDQSPGLPDRPWAVHAQLDRALSQGLSFQP